MKVGIATDHGGFGLKEELIAGLRATGHAVPDFGAQPKSARRLSRFREPRFAAPLSPANSTDFSRIHWTWWSTCGASANQ